MATTRRWHAYLGQALGRERRVLLGLFELRQSALGRLTLLMEGSLGLDERLALLVQVGLQLRDQGRELRKAHVRRRERDGSVAVHKRVVVVDAYLVLLLGLVGLERVELGEDVFGELGAEVIADAHLNLRVELHCRPRGAERPVPTQKAMGRGISGGVEGESERARESTWRAQRASNATEARHTTRAQTLRRIATRYLASVAWLGLLLSFWRSLA